MTTTNPAFTTWLPDQMDRQDDVGEFALHYCVDAEEAPRAVTADEVRQRMHEIEAEPVYFRMLDLAIEEYRRAMA